MTRTWCREPIVDNYLYTLGSISEELRLDPMHERAILAFATNTEIANAVEIRHEPEHTPELWQDWYDSLPVKLAKLGEKIWSELSDHDRQLMVYLGWHKAFWLTSTAADAISYRRFRAAARHATINRKGELTGKFWKKLRDRDWVIRATIRPEAKGQLNAIDFARMIKPLRSRISLVLDYQPDDSLIEECRSRFASRMSMNTITKVRKAPTKAMRKQTIRSMGLMDNIAGPEVTNLLRTNQPVWADGAIFSYKLTTPNVIKQDAHALKVEVWNPAREAKLGALCVYWPELPALDQAAAFMVKLAADEESELVARANLQGICEQPLLDYYKQVASEWKTWQEPNREIEEDWFLPEKPRRKHRFERKLSTSLSEVYQDYYKGDKEKLWFSAVLYVAFGQYADETKTAWKRYLEKIIHVNDIGLIA